MDGLYEMSDDQIGWCRSCGAAWFTLAPFDDEEIIASTTEDIGTAVCVNPDGAITGYSGKLVCLECGDDFVPGLVFREGRRHLRVVDVSDSGGTDV